MSQSYEVDRFPHGPNALDEPDPDTGEPGTGEPGTDVGTDVGTDPRHGRADPGDRPDGGADEGPDRAGSRRRSQAAVREAARVKRAMVRRAVERADQLRGLAEPDRAVVASMLGVSDTEVASLVAAILVPTRAGGPTADRDLLELADADPLEAGVLATQLAADRPRFRAAWLLAHALGVIRSAALPSTPAAKAGLTFARAAQSMSQDSRDRLAAAQALLTRTG